MITLFVSNKCPDCPPAVKALQSCGLAYRIVDITNSMAEMKEFFKYRDVHPFFEDIKARGKVGVPCLMKGDGETFYLYAPDFDLKTLEA